MYTTSGLYVEDFSNDIFPEDYDNAWAAWDSDEYESYYQESVESNCLPSLEEVNAKVESFLARAGVPQLNGSHLAYFNEAQFKADSYGVSVWDYLGLDAPY